jgi:hypothetical protein
LTKSKKGRGLAETRENKAERTTSVARAQIESDSERARAKTEKLRNLRLAKEAAEKSIPVGKLNASNDT